MANTGFKAWTTLEEYFVDNNVPTGRTKLNISGDPHYVAQVYNDTFCPIVGADTVAPSAPTNLTVTNVGSTDLNLNWDTSTDNIGVTGYYIYINNSTTPAYTVNYSASGNISQYITRLTPNTAYTFTINTFDAAGNKSTGVTSAMINTDTYSMTISGMAMSFVGDTTARFTCDKTFEATRYVGQTVPGYLSDGDKVYTNAAGTSPFLGQAKFYKVQDSFGEADYLVQISNLGVVTIDGTCTIIT